jgi:hypothetical protein
MEGLAYVKNHLEVENEEDFSRPMLLIIKRDSSNSNISQECVQEIENLELFEPHI